MTNTLDNETALAKIKVLVSNYYESKGRNEEFFINPAETLVEDIDDVLDNTEIDTKRVIIEKLEVDKPRHELSRRRNEGDFA